MCEKSRQPTTVSVYNTPLPPPITAPFPPLLLSHLSFLFSLTSTVQQIHCSPAWFICRRKVSHILAAAESLQNSHLRLERKMCLIYIFLVASTLHLRRLKGPVDLIQVLLLYQISLLSRWASLYSLHFPSTLRPLATTQLETWRKSPPSASFLIPP